MRKTKEEAELTKERIIRAAFNIFYENGLDASSLETICKAADVTRGAAYWHFKNKRDLYYQTIMHVLEKMDVVKQEIILNPNWSFKEKISKLLLLPAEMSELFSFINKASVFLADNPAFKDIYEEIEKAKVRLYEYFLLEATFLKEKYYDNSYEPEDLAILLFTMFEGTYNCRMPQPLENRITKRTINNYVDMIISNYVAI